MELRGAMYRPNMYVYFHAYVEAMRRGDVPGARCRYCYRPADLDGVSVEDESFRCRRCRRHELRKRRKLMENEEHGCDTTFDDKMVEKVTPDGNGVDFCSFLTTNSGQFQASLEATVNTGWVAFREKQAQQVVLSMGRGV